MTSKDDYIDELHERLRTETDRANSLAIRVLDAERRLAEAERLLAEAVQDIGEWSGYASEYFQQKNDLAGCLAKYVAFFRTADSAGR
jgi:predicted  nucleic acid-binding Zn-ribbon protein